MLVTLTLGSLPMPFDVLPHFIPVTRPLDDAVIVALAQRLALRRCAPSCSRRSAWGERVWSSVRQGLAADVPRHFRGRGAAEPEERPNPRIALAGCCEPRLANCRRDAPSWTICRQAQAASAAPETLASAAHSVIADRGPLQLRWVSQACAQTWTW